MSVLSVPILVRGRHIWDAQCLSEAELQARCDRMREVAADHGLDGVICYADSTSNGYVEFFTNYHCVQPFTNALLILPVKGPVGLVASVPPRDVPRIRGGFIPAEIEVLAAGMSPLASDHVGEHAAKYLTERGLAARRWGGINLSRCMKKTLDDLEKAVPDIVDLTEQFEQMRCVKSEAEIHIIAQAASLAGKAVQEMLRACGEGADECAAAAQSDRLIRSAGAEDIQLFIGTSETGGYLRRPQKRVPAKGETVKLLCQVQYLRYRGLFATTAVIGESNVPECVREHSEKFERLLGRLPAGAVLGESWMNELEIDGRVRVSLHGIGQDLTESPVDGLGSVRLEENMVLAVEWESDADSVMFADTVLCTKNGTRSLSGQEITQ